MGILTGLSPAKISQLTAAQIKALTASDIAGMTMGQLSALTASELSQLSGDQLAGFSAKQVGYLTMQALGGLTPAQMAQFSAAQIAGFNVAQMATFTPAQFAAIGLIQPAGHETMRGDVADLQRKFALSRMFGRHAKAYGMTRGSPQIGYGELCATCHLPVPIGWSLKATLQEIAEDNVKAAIVCRPGKSG